jgi:hypothetical protein
MIHLLTAHEINPAAPDLYWVGNFAPDFTTERQQKDTIHLRNISNRFEALGQLRATLDPDNPFEMGWLLHLFTDLCWDQEIIPKYQQDFEKQYPGQPWFFRYREEIGLASYYLSHHLDWAASIWARIKAADLSAVSSVLPVTSVELEEYRDRVYRKHTESDPASVSTYFTESAVHRFARETAAKFKEWTPEYVIAL